MFCRSGSVPAMPKRPRASASHCAVASTASTRTPNAGASVSRIKTTAQPAKALSSRAVGLGAWLVPPMGSGRSEFHENGPASITAWLPSACALTVDLLLAFSGCSSKRRTVWRIVSDCTFVLLPLAAYPPHDASRPGSTHPRKVYSPKCLEGEFCEVRIQDLAYNVARKPRGRPLGHLAIGERELHVVVAHKDPGM